MFSYVFAIFVKRAGRASNLGHGRVFGSYPCYYCLNNFLSLMTREETSASLSAGERTDSLAGETAAHRAVCMPCVRGCDASTPAFNSSSTAYRIQPTHSY